MKVLNYEAKTIIKKGYCHNAGGSTFDRGGKC